MFDKIKLLKKFSPLILTMLKDSNIRKILKEIITDKELRAFVKEIAGAAAEGAVKGMVNANK